MKMKRQYDMESKVVFYHVIIKVPDHTLGNSAYAFNYKNKSYLRGLLFWLESIYELEVINYCIMSTHAHFVIRRGRESKLSLKDVAYRFKKYKSLKEIPDARTCEVRNFAKRLNDLGDFMGNLQKRFTAWYNQQFKKRRRGQLFNHCYKAIQLKNSKALLRCLQYVELNPVRAQMVKNSADYEFCSFSEIKRKAELGTILKNRIVRALKEFGFGDLSDTKIYTIYSEPLCIIEELESIDFLANPELKLIYQKSSSWSSGRSISLRNEGFIMGKLV
jgi:REP element-mobilizing transposase RayT